MKAFLNWSGGKDSALCFWSARRQGIDVAALVTTVRGGVVPIHGIDREMIEAQAAAANLPLYLVALDEFPSYEAAVQHGNRQLAQAGFTHALSGDLFLEDLRAYREALYARDGLQALFPLWQREPESILQPFREGRFRALVVAVNGDMLPAAFCGRELDAAFFEDLPPSVDPCGERGAYHSFVYDAPFFDNPVAFEKSSMEVRHLDAPGSDAGSAKQIPFYFCGLRHVEQETGKDPGKL